MSSKVQRSISVGFFMATMVAVGSCTPSHPQSTFDALGPVAQDQLALFGWIFWAAVFVFVVVGGALLYTVIKFRDQGRMPRQVHGHMRLEIAWTIAPAIILAILAVPTITTLFKIENPPQENALRVEVIGHQWWWEFRYPDLGIVTANELRIPTEQWVIASLTSADVIHSFWIPKLAGKVDVVPTRTNSLGFNADETGVYFGQCAEFCGTAHAQMGLRVIAQPRDEFDNWVQQYQDAADVELTGLPAEGAQLFTTKGCIGCHTANGPPAFDQVGPNLTLFSPRTTLGSGARENSAVNLAQWLKDPDAIKPGNRMGQEAYFYQTPEENLTEDEIDALVAYLHNLQ